MALKIRECVKRGEPLHPSQKDDEDDGLLSSALIREALEAKESIMETKKAVGALFSSFSSGIAAKSSSLAAKSQSMRGTFSSAIGESLRALADAGGAKEAEDDAEEDEENEEGESPEKARKPKGELPEIGEEIDLSEEPWNQCIGMYSCKAIRRPAFVEALMAEAAEKKKKPQDPARTSFATAGSMFSRFAESAKSVMEESFVMITDKYIIEFKSNRLNIGSGTGEHSCAVNNVGLLCWISPPPFNCNYWHAEKQLHSPSSLTKWLSSSLDGKSHCPYFSKMQRTTHLSICALTVLWQFKTFRMFLNVTE